MGVVAGLGSGVSSFCRIAVALTKSRQAMKPPGYHVAAPRALGGGSWLTRIKVWLPFRVGWSVVRKPAGGLSCR
jgi:hypothetical protein